MAKGDVANVNNVDQTLSLGSQAWNVADGFTKIKILRHLVQLDRFETIAIFGTEDMDIIEEINDGMIAKRRVEAIYRMATTLRQLLGNVKFAMKKDDREKLEEFISDVVSVEDVLDGVANLSENMITHDSELRINEKHFNVCMKVLRRIKDEVNFPINNAGLIFRGSDEVDLDKIVTEIIEGG